MCVTVYCVLIFKVVIGVTFKLIKLRRRGNEMARRDEVYLARVKQCEFTLFSSFVRFVRSGKSRSGR